MPRFARAIAPGFPHHVTQRGNRRQPTFFRDDDYEAYIALLAEQCRANNVRVWGWCLMPNHAHLLVVPADESGLRLAIGNTHWRYSRRVNFREGWRGYLWQGRFSSCVLDDDHFLAAARYVDRNPVRAELVSRAEEWPWSSAASRILGAPDPLLDPSCPLPKASTGPWKDFLEIPTREEELAGLRLHTRTGRPLGSPEFVTKVSALLGRDFEKKKPGRKTKERGI